MVWSLCNEEYELVDTDLHANPEYPVLLLLDMADRLEYFDVRARAEPLRMMYALTDTKYEDERFPFTEWPTRKPSKCPLNK